MMGLRIKQRRTLGATAALLAALVAAVLGPQSSSQAAQGIQWHTGVGFAGVLHTNSGVCSVTVVSEFLAITSKHCGRVNPRLKLDAESLWAGGHYVAVKQIVPDRDLDVEAIFLRDRTGLNVVPLGTGVARDWFYAWGYGRDWSNNFTGHLTRANFTLPELCPNGMPADLGSLCWQTTAKNTVCFGDSGGPLTQHHEIIGMVTGGLVTVQGQCSTTVLGQALTVHDMQPWLNQMIAEANPF